MECLPIEFSEKGLVLLDQRGLPNTENYVVCQTPLDVRDAIHSMVVRGAPAIGFAGIFGLALEAKNQSKFDRERMAKAAEEIKGARPTAVNLAYEVDRALETIKGINDKDKAYQVLREFALDQIHQLETFNRSMAKNAIEELDKRVGKEKYNILTHCNTGFLACGSIGTALGIVQVLGESGRVEQVWVDETRPYMQGSRLTSFELTKLGIPHHIVVEGAASYLMKKGLVDAVFVGADRIVANGDTANKIGTSNLSIVCDRYKVPFYVAAPLSTFDPKTPNGDQIEIELRDEKEVLEIAGRPMAPVGARALNPSFDVTDSDLITAIISEEGVIRPPYTETIRKVYERKKS